MTEVKKLIFFKNAFYEITYTTISDGEMNRVCLPVYIHVGKPTLHRGKSLLESWGIPLLFPTDSHP